MPTVEVEITIGNQLPVIPFFELVGNTGATLFLQRGAITSKTGAIGSLTTTDKLTPVAFCPKFGVNK